MIDIFNELYTLVETAVTTYATSKEITIGMDSEHVNQPSSFPFVSVEELDNLVYERTSNCEIENHALNEFEVNIYTKGSYRKSVANEIANVVDDVFKTCGLFRGSKNNFSENDGTTFHVILRYSGVVSKDKVIYRR